MKMARVLQGMVSITMKITQNKNSLYEKIKFTKYQGIEFLYDQPLDDFYEVYVSSGASEILITKKVSITVYQTFIYLGSSFNQNQIHTYDKINMA